MNWNQAIATIKENQADMRELISKWADMLNATPADVSFELFDGTVHTVPNIAKIASALRASDVTNDSTYIGATVKDSLDFLKTYSDALDIVLLALRDDVDNIMTVAGVDNEGTSILTNVTTAVQYVGITLPANTNLVLKSVNYDIRPADDIFKLVVIADMNSWYSSYSYGSESTDTLLITNNTLSPLRTEYLIGIKNTGAPTKIVDIGSSWTLKVKMESI